MLWCNAKWARGRGIFWCNAKYAFFHKIALHTNIDSFFVDVITVFSGTHKVLNMFHIQPKVDEEGEHSNSTCIVWCVTSRH